MVERVLGLIFCISVIVRVFLRSDDEQFVFISGSALAFTYLFANWWISKPISIQVRTIGLTVFYGVSACILTITLIFQVLFYPGAQLLSILSIMFFLVIFSIDFISSYKKKMVLTSSGQWRFGILTSAVCIFYLVPLESRIQFTYRDQPEFLVYYHSNKDKLDFVDLKDSYFNSDQRMLGMSSMEHEYLSMDTAYTSHEAFDDSVCQIALDSANRRFAKGKFELFAFMTLVDSSQTPIHLLQQRFGLRVLAFAREEFVFKFCFNKAMLAAFASQHHFDPIDSVGLLYDSLEQIGQTQISAKYPGGFDEFQKYMVCNLEFPASRRVSAPYPNVRVRFRISPSGVPDEVAITKSFSTEYDNAVLKLIEDMPAWTPCRETYGGYCAEEIQMVCIFDPNEKEKRCR